MKKKELPRDMRFAQEQIAHEKRVIKKFAEEPANENTASVILDVSGVEHIILIHDEDFGKLAHLLLKFNKKESMRMEGAQLILSAVRNRPLSYSVGVVSSVWGYLHCAAAMMLSMFVFTRGLFVSK